MGANSLCLKQKKTHTKINNKIKHTLSHLKIVTSTDKKSQVVISNYHRRDNIKFFFF